MIFIPGNVPSKKTSQQLFIRQTAKGPRPGFLPSKLTREYIKNTQWLYIQQRPKFLDLIRNLPKPLFIGFHFVRADNRSFDFAGPQETIQDILTLHRFIPDDNISEMVPIPLFLNGKSHHVSKTNPGVYIHVFTSLPTLDLQQPALLVQ